VDNKEKFQNVSKFSKLVARDLTIFMVHVLAIQHVTSASGSLVTSTTATVNEHFKKPPLVSHYPDVTVTNAVYFSNMFPTTI